MYYACMLVAGQICCPQVCPPVVYCEPAILKLHDYIHVKKEDVYHLQYITVKEPNGNVIKVPVVNHILPHIRHRIKDGWDVRHFYYGARIPHKGQTYMKYVRIKNEKDFNRRREDIDNVPTPPQEDKVPVPKIPNESDLFKDVPEIK